MGSSTSAYMYAATSGYRNDGDAGLSKVGCRYYDAQTGTFTSRDTYLDQKPYLYCEHDPVNHLDASGHNALFIIALVVLVVAYAYDRWHDSHNTPDGPNPGISKAGEYAQERVFEGGGLGGAGTVLSTGQTALDGGLALGSGLRSFGSYKYACQDYMNGEGQDLQSAGDYWRQHGGR